MILVSSTFLIFYNVFCRLQLFLCIFMFSEFHYNVKFSVSNTLYSPIQLKWQMAEPTLGSITSSTSTTIQAGDQNQKVRFRLTSKQPLTPGQLNNLIKLFAIIDEIDGGDRNLVDVNGKNFVLVTPASSGSSDDIISIRVSKKGELLLNYFTRSTYRFPSRYIHYTFIPNVLISLELYNI